MPEALVALDAGTTGVTAVLYDAALTPLRRAYRELPQSFPRPGWVEHDARDVVRGADETLAEVLAHPRGADAVALGITNQRETLFALDRASGEALRPGIVWQDRRTAERCRELAASPAAALVRERTGLVVDPYFSATKAEWWMREDADLARRARCGDVVLCTVDALLVRHLTRGAAPATEPTNASRTMLFDIGRRAWDAELCALFGLEPGWLPEVRPSVGSFGEAQVGARRLPILGIAGDQQAALFGQGCVDEGAFKSTYGTGGFLLLNTGARRVDSTRGLLTTLAVARDGAPCFAIEGSIFMAGALLQWLRDGLGLFERYDEVEALARSVPDAGGVTIVPAFTGLGAPYWDAEARGAVLGLTRGVRRAHLARAALEAIAFQNAEFVEILRAETGLPVRELRADGGAAQNDLLMELQADLAGLEVVRPESVEATARGAAALAGLGAGLWEAQAVPTAAAAARRFPPRLGAAARAERLAGWRRAVARVLTRPG